MAATVAIQSAHGSTASWGVVVSTVRFKRSDDDTADTNNQLLKLSFNKLLNGISTQDAHSYWKTFRVNVLVAAVGEISNLRFFKSSGTNTGVNEKYGFTATYTQAVGNTEGTNLGGSLSLVAVTGVPTGPVAVTGGQGPLIGKGVLGNMTVVQWELLGATVALGTLNTVVYTFRYDEI